MNQRYQGINRRLFLHKLMLSGAATVGSAPSLFATELSPPEITTIRILFDPKVPVLCYAPQYVAIQFLRDEGFTDVQFVPFSGEEFSESKTLIANEADFTAELCPDWILSIDRDDPIVVLAGLHAGCTELIGGSRVDSISDLKGKRVAITGGTEQTFVAAIAAHIGLDPLQDITWIKSNPNDWPELLQSGEVDAIITFPPMSYEMHRLGIGKVILNTTVDEPWRHYFCCMLGANRHFVRKYPVATKRALRAIVKASILCSTEPESSAKWLVENGFSSDYQDTLSTLKDIPYGAWRDYDPEDTLRFYALRLRDAGLIKKTPQEIIKTGSDWKYINELKTELKV